MYTLVHNVMNSNFSVRLWSGEMDYDDPTLELQDCTQTTKTPKANESDPHPRSAIHYHEPSSASCRNIFRLSVQSIALISVACYQPRLRASLSITAQA